MRDPPRSICSSRLLILVFLAVGSTGCQTPMGHYLANRGRDLGECFLLQTGFGLGLGADVKAAGLVHGSAILGTLGPAWSVGWTYGEGRPKERVTGHLPLEGDWGLPLTLFRHGLLHQSGDYRDGEWNGHMCYGLLPALLSWTGCRFPNQLANPSRRTWLWRRESVDGERPEAYEKFLWSRVHAFDIEVGAYAFLVGARAGFSPGEFLDFLLGWFGVDIAGDDVPLATGERETDSSVAGR